MSCATTRLFALRLKKRTLRAKDSDSLSSYIPGSQLVSPRLGPALQQASDRSFFILFGVLSQQFPHHHLCTEFTVCQSFVKNVKNASVFKCCSQIRSICFEQTPWKESNTRAHASRGLSFPRPVCGLTSPLSIRTPGPTWLPS